MYQAVADACDRVDAERSIRAFVLRGAGGSFASGTDIAEFEHVTSGSDGLAYEQRLDAVVDRVERVGVATIAQVEGVAAGGGLLLAGSGGFPLFSPRAEFGGAGGGGRGKCLSARD